MDVKPNRSLNWFEAFPFLALPVLIYNLLALFAPPSPPGSLLPGLIWTLRAEALALPMLSGATLSLDWGDILLLFAIGCLLVEVVKAPRTAGASIVNHMLSMMLFIVCLVEFLLLPGFASAPFFLLTMIVLLDAMAGTAVTIISARRDLDVGGVAGG